MTRYKLFKSFTETEEFMKSHNVISRHYFASEKRYVVIYKEE